MINNCFCIYSMTDWAQLNTVLKKQLHRVLQLELEQMDKDSQMF